ncbi:DVU_1556 family methyltransferase [Solidesulfovibrio sp. C21]|uniref:DVU_1556 family methyltransferase n=1 Tax=Solidesulfovibrio sp. C21 TaxID=3398613 RepID=UPI0039FC090D
MPCCVAPYEREDFREVAGETLRPGGLALTGRALAACRFSPGARVLDVGCGPGASLAFLTDAKLTAYGLDASSFFTRQAGRIAPVVQGLGQTLPFREESLDGVLCECVLSASGDGPGCLAEIARVLRPGGLLLATDLYLRQGAPLDENGAGCAAGAVTREALAVMFGAAGFALRLFEDHTRLLTELACRLTFALGSAASAVSLLTGRDPACAGQGSPRPKFGYCLCIAAKESL